ncbi:MAG TPA: hypothetical protein VLE70_08905, partial [Anaerolineae bacterium]|nr:hypothetical protein [Anaerolineae bacterium]
KRSRVNGAAADWIMSVIFPETDYPAVQHSISPSFRENRSIGFQRPKLNRFVVESIAQNGRGRYDRRTLVA